MQYSIAEILELVEAEPDLETKALILREHNSGCLKAILAGALDPTVRWMLPYGPMPYRPGPDVGLENALQNPNNWTKFWYFTVPVPGANAPPFDQRKREDIFTLLLEGVHPKDAVLLLAMKDKRLPYPSITPQVVNMAFPGFLRGVPVEAPPVPQRKPKTAKRPSPVPTTQEAAPAPVKRGRGRPKGSKNKKAGKVAAKAPAQSKRAALEDIPILQAEPEALYLGGGEVLPHNPEEAAALMGRAPVQRGLPTKPSMVDRAKEELWLGGGEAAENDG